MLFGLYQELEKNLQGTADMHASTLVGVRRLYSHLLDLLAQQAFKRGWMHGQAFDWHQRQFAVNRSKTKVVLLEPPLSEDVCSR